MDDHFVEHIASTTLWAVTHVTHASVLDAGTVCDEVGILEGWSHSVLTGRGRHFVNTESCTAPLCGGTAQGIVNRHQLTRW